MSLPADPVMEKLLALIGPPAPGCVHCIGPMETYAGWGVREWRPAPDGWGWISFKQTGGYSEFEARTDFRKLAHNRRPRSLLALIHGTEIVQVLAPGDPS